MLAPVEDLTVEGNTNRYARVTSVTFFSFGLLREVGRLASTDNKAKIMRT